ncbi:MAG: hypothetical protein KZQ89_02910 [Candidatus Thiodiazotropha sp. (ex Lucinoma kastoroae)]|nr:hypothetical protein [Candidatus Thiodiazotropha sp. (ex Lucinoma kastoroae)]
MLKKLLVTIAIFGLASCSSSPKIYYDGKLVKSRSAPSKISPEKAITFGKKPSIFELATKQGISGNGGIKQGFVVVVPSVVEWRDIFDRAFGGKPQLNIKTINLGDSIAKANRNVSNTRTNLYRGAIPILSLPSAPKNSCKVILDGTGEPITIRKNKKGINRYGFQHFINVEKYKHDQLERQVDQFEENVKKQVLLLERLKHNFTNNRAFQKGQCVLVKQRPIPPAPKRIDPKKIVINAHGACVNLMGSRFTEEKVVNALEAAGQWDVTKNYQKWVFGKKMSCAAGVSIPEFESLKTRVINWFAPNLGKEYFRQALRKDIYSCVGQVKKRCDDGYDAWVVTKRNIISEPKRLKNSCLSDKHKLASYDFSAYNDTKSQLINARKRRDISLNQQKQIGRYRLIPFTDKRTYCKI